MKKSTATFLLIAAAFITQAQDKKPTKEETINYLKTVLLSKDNIGYWSNRSDGKYNIELSVIEFSLQNCILNVKEKREDYDDNTVGYNLYEFDLSKIEKVETYSPNKAYKKIVFNPINHQSIIKRIYNNGKEEKESMITSASFCIDADPDRILKAFNHLRKLCGAPEPIKF